MQDKKILYVEDHPLNAEILRRIIRKLWAVEIDIADTAEEGLRRLTKAHYDLIYMDIHLPGMSGLEAIQEIKGNPALAGIPIIAVTADASPSTQEEIIEVGGDGYIPKPIDVEVLKERTEGLLSETQGALP